MDGLPVAHLTRGGKTLTTFLTALPEGIERAEVLTAVLTGLNELVASGQLSKLVIEKANGRSIFDGDLAGELRALGAALTPKGVRITGSAEPARPARHGGRRAADAMEELSFDDPAEPDDPPPAPGSPGGFRPRRRRR